MKKLFANDLSMKILSLVISIVFWIYLVMVLNPDVEITVSDIPVSFSGHQSLTQNDYAIMNETQNVITLKLRGTRTMLANVNKNNITAYVDLSSYNQAGSFSLPIHVRLPYEEITVVEKKPYNINVVIDNLITEQFKATVQVNGSPKGGYAVYNPTISATMVEVKGPEEIVKTIDKVVVPLDVSDAQDDVIRLENVVLLDSNGEAIIHKDLSITPEKMEARCYILKQKTVPVVPVLSNSDRYEAAVPSGEVTIIGEDAALDQVNELYTATINVDNITETSQVTASLVVPQDVHLLQEGTGVTVEVKPKG